MTQLERSAERSMVRRVTMTKESLMTHNNHKPQWVLRSTLPGWAPRLISTHASQSAAHRALSHRLKALRADPPRVWNEISQTWEHRIPTFDVIET